VTWLWPSPKTQRPLEDFRVTTGRIDPHGYYLGRFLSKIDGDVKVGLMGYSFGTSVVAGAVHFLAGGRLAGRELSGETESSGETGPSGQTGPKEIRAVLWSAAMHNHRLLPGQRYGKAVPRLDGLYVLVNPHDPVLKRYALVFPNAQPAALGYTGVSRCRFPLETRSKVFQTDISSALDATHKFDAHYGSPYVMRQTVSFLTWQP